MDKNKNKSCSDELALVKAAAWAWYQRGSGSERKLMREFDIKPIERAYRPSRYKLEAMRNNTIEESQTPTPTRSSISLLDPYEIERISQRLDDLIEFSGTEFYKQLLSVDCDYEKNLVPDGGKKKKKRSILKRFFLRPAMACGKNQDVDDRALVHRGRR